MFHKTFDAGLAKKNYIYLGIKIFTVFSDRYDTSSAPNQYH